MSGLFKHKFIVILIIFSVVYWIRNPAGRFGFTRKGFTVYNRMPVCLFDASVSADGSLHLESDLSIPVNVTYWIDNHLFSERRDDGSSVQLIVGTGFGTSKEITFSQEQLQLLRDRRFQIRYLPSDSAVVRYNELRDRKEPVAILLKVK